MNPLFQHNNNLSMLKQIKSNQQMYMQQMMQQNPQVQQIIKQCQGKDPKQVFYSECQRRGVNPDDIISLLK